MGPLPGVAALMYRRKTVEAIVRQHQRERDGLLAVIREQNDRIMHLAGRTFAPTPLDLHVWPVEELEPDEGDLVADVGQLPDDLGADAY